MKQNMFCTHGMAIICDDGQAPLADIYAFLEPDTLMTNGQGDISRAIRDAYYVPLSNTYLLRHRQQSCIHRLYGQSRVF